MLIYTDKLYLALSKPEDGDDGGEPHEGGENLLRVQKGVGLDS